MSLPNEAFNGFGNDVLFRRNTPFELVSFYLTAAFYHGTQVIVTAYRKGVKVDSETFTVNTEAPTLETFDWDVNEVAFHSNIQGYPIQFVLDNLTTMPITEPSTEFQSLSAIPEASTWALMLVGFAGLGCAGFHKAKSGPAALDVA